MVLVISIRRLNQLNHTDRPSCIIWVQFDHEAVGKKTSQDNRQLYIKVRSVQTAWTPIKPLTTQFAVGRHKATQVDDVWKDLNYSSTDGYFFRNKIH